MKYRARLASVLVLSCLVGPSPLLAAMRPAPPTQIRPACYSVLSLPCGECPGVRSKFCTPDPSGLFQTCSETLAGCDDTHHCSDVLTSSGPACGH